MKRLAACLAVPAVLLLLVAPLLLSGPPPTGPIPAGCSPDGGAFDVTAVATSGNEREANVAAIVAVGQHLQVPPRGWVIAVMTAIQESGLRSLHHGLGSSLGLFQQPDSWGPAEDRTDPAKAAAMFFTGGPRGQSGLLDVKGWEAMDLWQASHAVQRSAFPTAVRRQEPAARDLIAKVAGGRVQPAALEVVCPPPGAVALASGAAGTGACPVTRFTAVEVGLQPAARKTVRCAVEAWPQLKSIGGRGGRGNDSYHPRGEATDLMIPNWDSPEGVALGDQIAAWGIANAATLGITEVIWNDRIATTRGDFAWRPYLHPNCSSVASCDPNLRHRNHVHMSVPQTAASVAI